jgi:nuclear protein localization family protein 4
MSDLRTLEAPSLHPGGESYKKIELAKWLSDWHFVAFLETTGLFSPEDIKIMMRTVSSPDLLEDAKNIDPVLSTESWQTLMTFTQESAPARPGTSAPSGSAGDAMDDDIPPEIFDQIAAEQAASQAAGGSSGGIRICPHCTFENAHGGSDCEVCGLPLA